MASDAGVLSRFADFIRIHFVGHNGFVSTFQIGGNICYAFDRIDLVCVVGRESDCDNIREGITVILICTIFLDLSVTRACYFRIHDNIHIHLIQTHVLVNLRRCVKIRQINSILRYQS